MISIPPPMLNSTPPEPAAVASAAAPENAKRESQLSPLIATTRTTLIGGAIGLGMLATFIGWATLAPLNSAVIANGYVKVSGYRQKVQHLEGGIIDIINVQEGDVVREGQVLYRLTNAQLTASRQLIIGQLFSARAVEARIKAEQVEAADISFPPDVLASKDPDVHQFVEAQRTAFKARRAAYHGSIAMKDERIKQTGEETIAYRALIRSLQKQLPLIRAEVEDQQQLWDKKLTRKAQLHQLRRTEAQIEAEIDKNQALVSRTLASIAEIEEDKLQQRRKILDDLAQERKTVSDTLHDLRQKLVALDDAVERLVVRSPITGVVVARTANTIGGVVGPRETLVDVVPQDARLLIEASIKPSDIDVVRAGLPVQVQFSAYTARRTNRVAGKVALVSADRLVDSKGQAGFKVDIEVDAKEVKRIAGLSLYPGMPADAFIETGSRTAAATVPASTLAAVRARAAGALVGISDRAAFAAVPAVGSGVALAILAIRRGDPAFAGVPFAEVAAAGLAGGVERRTAAFGHRTGLQQQDRCHRGCEEEDLIADHGASPVRSGELSAPWICAAFAGTDRRQRTPAVTSALPSDGRSGARSAAAWRRRRCRPRVSRRRAGAAAA
jgi:epimerase transport system membrane fusion protein